MKLKTLKDFGEYYLANDSSAEHLAWMIRKEAIKWVKAMDNDNFMPLVDKEAHIWIKHFFNITEEDLE